MNYKVELIGCEDVKTIDDEAKIVRSIRNKIESFINDAIKSCSQKKYLNDLNKLVIKPANISTITFMIEALYDIKFDYHDQPEHYDMKLEIESMLSRASYARTCKLVDSLFVMD